MAAEEQDADDQAQVEQHRRRRVHPEAVQRIEDAAQQRHQADEQQVGEGQSRQPDGERELGRGRAVEAAGQRVGDRPGRQLHDQRHRDQHGQQHRERVGGERDPRGQSAAVRVRHLAVEHRDERRREGSFGKQRAEHVGQAKGDQEGIGREARADEPREQRVAHQAEHPAGERQPADRAQRAVEVHACPLASPG